MAKGRRKKTKEVVKEVPKVESGWTVRVKLLRALIHPYRISGKVDDVIEIPTNLLDELIQAKKVVKV